MGVCSGHRGMHLSELQILPYLTNRAFDIGCDQRLPQSDCQIRVRVAAHARDPAISKPPENDIQVRLGPGGVKRLS